MAIRQTELSSNAELYTQFSSTQQQYELDDRQFLYIKEHSLKKISFWSTFNNNYRGYKGTALKVAEYTLFFSTAGGLGIWAYAKIKHTSRRSPLHTNLLISSISREKASARDELIPSKDSDPKTASDEDKLKSPDFDEDNGTLDSLDLSDLKSLQQADYWKQRFKI